MHSPKFHLIEVKIWIFFHFRLTISRFLIHEVFWYSLLNSHQNSKFVYVMNRTKALRKYCETRFLYLGFRLSIVWTLNGISKFLQSSETCECHMWNRILWEFGLKVEFYVKLALILWYYVYVFSFHKCFKPLKYSVNNR